MTDADMLVPEVGRAAATAGLSDLVRCAHANYAEAGRANSAMWR